MFRKRTLGNQVGIQADGVMGGALNIHSASLTVLPRNSTPGVMCCQNVSHVLSLTALPISHTDVRNAFLTALSYHSLHRRHSSSGADPDEELGINTCEWKGEVAGLGC